MDNNNNNKYQNDEQVKKNIEQFTSDRESFLKEANQPEGMKIKTENKNIEENIKGEIISERKNKEEHEQKNDRIYIVIGISILLAILNLISLIVKYRIVDETARDINRIILLFLPLVIIITIFGTIILLLGYSTRTRILILIGIILNFNSIYVTPIGTISIILEIYIYIKLKKNKTINS